jgi:putative endonuclease
MNSYKSGRIAEFYARMFLRLKGYKIISKNIKTKKETNIGEIDFIASKGKCLIFVEVKKRSSLENAAYAISTTQKKRIIRGAELYLKKNTRYKDFDIRFDAVLIAFPYHIRHIKNAWQC